MKHLLRYCLALCPLFIVANGWAHGDVSCNEPKEQWRSQMELQKKLKSEGWKVRMVNTENGCYEVYGFDEKKARVEAFFNPKTFERVGLPTSAM